MNSTWFFVSDLHGRTDRYEKLFARIAADRPRAVLLGGDLLPHGLDAGWAKGSQRGDFVRDFLAPGFAAAVDGAGGGVRVLLILGNDDPRSREEAFLAEAAAGRWDYLHLRRAEVDGVPVYGYACVPPTPFMLKDWDCYDVSRFVDPGCVSPEEGRRSVPRPAREVRHETIRQHLEELAGDDELGDAVMLFHSPPYRTLLDRAALDGRSIDHAPLDPNVGSIAIRRFIAARRPRLTLHGHVHESARLTGSWRDRLGGTVMLTAAHDGPELALVRFDPADPEGAERDLI